MLPLSIRLAQQRQRRLAAAQQQQQPQQPQSSESVDSSRIPIPATTRSDDLLPQLLQIRVSPAVPSNSSTDSSSQVPATLADILSSEYYRDRPVILTFLRRFGCPVCRTISAGLSHLKESVLDRVGVRLVAVAMESIGYDEYHRKQYFRGEVLVDEDGAAFAMLQLKRLGFSNAFGLAQLRQTNAAIALALSYEGTRGTNVSNMEGNKVQLGGLFVLNARRDHFLLEFRESFAGDTPLVADILDALQGELHNEGGGDGIGGKEAFMLQQYQEFRDSKQTAFDLAKLAEQEQKRRAAEQALALEQEAEAAHQWKEGTSGKNRNTLVRFQLPPTDMELVVDQRTRST